jgi:hypothetical protein
MARLVGMTQAALKLEVRPAYVKVAEYQRRGLVHVHVIARLDRAMPAYRGDEIHPPAPRFDAVVLEQAVRDAVGDVSAPIPDVLGGGRIRWGDVCDVRSLRTGGDRGEIAGYLAKYATKSTEQAGGLLHRVAAEDVDRAPVRAHVRQYMRAAFELNDTTIARRPSAPPLPAAPAIDVETDWIAAAPAIVYAARWVSTSAFGSACTTAPYSSAALPGCDTARQRVREAHLSPNWIRARVSMAIGFSPAAAIEIPQSWPLRFPAGGRRGSPVSCDFRSCWERAVGE